VPGAQQTNARGISGNTIVGSYWDASGYAHGFLYNGSTYTTLNAPGATETNAIGIDGSNIVGTYTVALGYQHGYLYNGSTYTTLDVPGAVYTDALGISGSNIVGTYMDASGNWHSFLATPAAVPVPAGILLFAPGLAGLAVLRQKYIGWRKS
jgi:uncharacterized membrane protein